MTWALVAMMGPTGGDAQGGGSSFLLTIGLMVLVIYFLLIRPQRREQKKQEELLRNLQKGDRVITTGGLLGRVLAVHEERLTLDLGNKVKVDVLRSAIRGLQEKGTEAQESDSAS